MSERNVLAQKLNARDQNFTMVVLSQKSSKNTGTSWFSKGAIVLK
jgi:hypothetical protein